MYVGDQMVSHPKADVTILSGLAIAPQGARPMQRMGQHPSKGSKGHSKR